ncbi:hypothetical protein chiPu_0020454 [Chiloscyllium punctatum]|uniref:Uncharacterized protein n=1 Tax=Chiloscyllium punctatum TaxID=137246 RepID=A0A401RFQ2_CHIPU|nr:hypothetical protein [Chiloscyllium punctatum]
MLFAALTSSRGHAYLRVVWQSIALALAGESAAGVSQRTRPLCPPKFRLRSLPASERLVFPAPCTFCLSGSMPSPRQGAWPGIHLCHGTGASMAVTGASMAVGRLHVNVDRLAFGTQCCLKVLSLPLHTSTLGPSLGWLVVERAKGAAEA